MFRPIQSTYNANFTLRAGIESVELSEFIDIIIYLLCQP